MSRSETARIARIWAGSPLRRSSPPPARAARSHSTSSATPAQMRAILETQRHRLAAGEFPGRGVPQRSDRVDDQIAAERQPAGPEAGQRRRLHGRCASAHVTCRRWR
ncbi:MAG TPA: hypothetical protein PLP91_08790 [Plasticicumulans sp.]|nr:hypothetical protein [Plasticicumulans sp.]